MYCTLKSLAYLEAGFSKPNIFGEAGDDCTFLWINLLDNCLKIISLHAISTE